MVPHRAVGSCIISGLGCKVRDGCGVCNSWELGFRLNRGLSNSASQGALNSQNQVAGVRYVYGAELSEPIKPVAEDSGLSIK